MYIIELNTLSEADLPELNRLMNDLGEQKGEKYHGWEVYKEINENALVYTARRDNDRSLVGMGILNVDYKAPPPNFGNLQSIAVLPDHRMNGVFSQILDRIEAKARERDLGVLAIQCKKRRHRVAFKAYKRRGYRELVPLSGILIGDPQKVGRR